MDIAFIQGGESNPFPGGRGMEKGVTHYYWEEVIFFSVPSSWSHTLPITTFDLSQFETGLLEMSVDALPAEVLEVKCANVCIFEMRQKQDELMGDRWIGMR